MKTAIIFTALGLETKAVLRHLSKRTDEVVSGTTFFRGEFEGWDVALAEVGPGNTAAAAISERGLSHYKPSVALFVGIAGGVKDVAIGDVVVGTSVYGYESGKDTAGGFKPRPDVMRSAHEIQQRAIALRQYENWRKRLDSALGHADPKIEVGPIAAGSKVVGSARAATSRFISEYYSDALAVEMEGRGFLGAVHINHPVLGGVVRGISDLLSGKSQSDKAGSQELAADVASAVAFEILAGLGSGTVMSKATPKFLETATTFAPSAYFGKGEVLARIGVPNVDEVLFSFSDAPEAYIRIIPTEPKDRPIPQAHLLDVVSQFALLRPRGFGGLTAINKYGAILHQPDRAYAGGPAPMDCAVQLFPNGELWCVSNTLVIRERGHRRVDLPIPLIPSLGLEQAFHSALHKNLALGPGYVYLSFPCVVELGLLRLEGTYLGLTNEDVRGPIQRPEVIVRREIIDDKVELITAVLLEFFNEIHDGTGYARPPGLYGFPPSPPRE